MRWVDAVNGHAYLFYKYDIFVDEFKLYFKVAVALADGAIKIITKDTQITPGGPLIFHVQVTPRSTSKGIQHTTAVRKKSFDGEFYNIVDAILRTDENALIDIDDLENSRG